MSTPVQNLVEFLASRLWDSSTLRHGMFVPPDFPRLCRENMNAALATEEGQRLLALTQEYRGDMRDAYDPECLEGPGRTCEQQIADTKALNAVAPNPGDKLALMMGFPPFDKLPVHNPPGVTTNAIPWPVCRYCGGEMRHTLVESFCSGCGYQSHADGDCGWPDEEGVLQHRNPNEART